MTWIIGGGVAIVALAALWRFYMTADIPKIVRALRWFSGGAVALLTVFLALRGQLLLASFTAPIAFAIFRTGRIGPVDFTSTTGVGGAETGSIVRSRYFTMTLDHTTGDVAGTVIDGSFKGRDLFDLGPDETRTLLAEVGNDPESLSLLETWLDRNRAGWRDYFAEEDGAASQEAQSNADPDQEAYDILGLKPGATAEDIRAAHRNLMLKLHPDQGGSTYLASRINAAKDRLLRKKRV